MVVAGIVRLVEDLGIAALNVSAFTGLMNTRILALVILLRGSLEMRVYIRRFQGIANV